MEASFYPSRHPCSNNTFEHNLNLQHEALKRIVNVYYNMSIHRINEEEQIPIIEKMPPPKQIKPRRRTKKDIKDLISLFLFLLFTTKKENINDIILSTN